MNAVYSGPPGRFQFLDPLPSGRNCRRRGSGGGGYDGAVVAVMPGVGRLIPMVFNGRYHGSFEFAWP